MTDPLFDDLSGLLCYARVVETRSFTKAAKLLGISKSLVSQRVAALEARMGERLLLRTTRQVEVSDAGLEVYAAAARMLEHARTATREATDAHRGVLRISAPVTFAQMYLGPPLSRFAARHPDVRLELLLDDRLVDLAAERIDLAIRVTKLEDSSLVARRLCSTSLHVCGAPSYLQARGTPTRPEDLLGHDCLRYSALRVEQEWRLYGAQGRIPVPVRGSFEASDGTLLREAAIAGMGLAMLPRFMIHEALADGRLVSVLDPFAPRPLGIHALSVGRRATPGRLKDLVDTLARAFRTPAWAK